MAANIASAGFILLVIGIGVNVTSRYYAWIGRPGKRGDNRLFRGWRMGTKVEILISRYIIIAGGILFGIGGIMTAATQ